jgi:hypothetical protein
MNAVLRTLIRRFTIRLMAGEDTARIVDDLRLDAWLAFDLLEHGVGDYALRRAEPGDGDDGSVASPDRVQT